MANFPLLSSGSVAKYPLTGRNKQRVGILTALDMTEQRFPMGLPLVEFALVYNNLKTSDKEILRQFFDDQRGELASTWSITLDDKDRDGTHHLATYANMQFIPGSRFEAQNFKFDRWSVTLNIRQTRPL